MTVQGDFELGSASKLTACISGALTALGGFVAEHLNVQSDGSLSQSSLMVIPFFAQGIFWVIGTQTFKQIGGGSQSRVQLENAATQLFVRFGLCFLSAVFTLILGMIAGVIWSHR